MENVETKSASVESRRNFLKKAAYVAPAVIALGALTAPVSAHASVVFNEKPFYNGANKRAMVTEHYDNVGHFTVDGTFTPDGGTTTVYERKQIVEAPKNWLQIFFNNLFRPIV